MLSALPSVSHRAITWLGRRFASLPGACLRRFVAVDSLGERERELLGPQLYEIFCLSYGELSSEVVLDEIVFKPGSSLGLYYDAGGELVGFAGAKASPLSAEGKRCLALCGSVYFRPGYRGGWAAARLSLMFALALKLRHPLHALVYALEMLSPVSYRRGTKTFAQIYPHRELATPSWIAGLSQAVIRQRGLLGVEGQPWLVRYGDPATHARELPAPLQSEDPDIAFYLAHNPGYREGDIMLTLAPLSLTNLVASFTPVLRTALRRVSAQRS